MRKQKEKSKRLHFILDSLVDSHTDFRAALATLEGAIKDCVLKTKYHQLVEAHNKVVERLNEVNHKVKYVMDSWPSEWDSGSSWKQGYRPYGTSIYEDYDNEEPFEEVN